MVSFQVTSKSTGMHYHLFRSSIQFWIHSQYIFTKLLFVRNKCCLLEASSAAKVEPQSPSAFLSATMGQLEDFGPGGTINGSPSLDVKTVFLSWIGTRSEHRM